MWASFAQALPHTQGRRSLYNPATLLPDHLAAVIHCIWNARRGWSLATLQLGKEVLRVQRTLL
jgi:hypothetical protein